MVTLGIDFGVKKTGLALSDGLGLSAHPLEVIDTSSFKKAAIAIAKICNENEVQLIVMGSPTNASGQAGSLQPKIERFAKYVAQETNLKIVYWDETLSSWLGEKNAPKSPKKDPNKSKILNEAKDHYAAQVILQDYLDANRVQSEDE